MASVFRDDKTAHYEEQFRGLRTGRFDKINIDPLAGVGTMVGVSRANQRAPNDMSELIMRCTWTLEFNDVVIFMSDGFNTVLGKVVAGTVHFSRDLDVDQVNVTSSSGTNYVIKAGSKLISAGTDYRRIAYNLKIVCRDHKVVVNALEYKLVGGKPKLIGKRARSVNYYCVDGSIFARYYHDIFGKNPEAGEELVGIFIAAFTTCHTRLMNNAGIDTSARSLELICHWDIQQSLASERRAFIKKAKENAKANIRMGRFTAAAARPPSTPSDWGGSGGSGGSGRGSGRGRGGSRGSRGSRGSGRSGRGSGPTAANPMNLDGPSVFRAGGHGHYDSSEWTHRHNARGGHRPGADDMDESFSASKRNRQPDGSTISGFSAMRGRKKTNVARRSPSPTPTTATEPYSIFGSSGGGSGSSTSDSSNPSTIKYNQDDDGDGYQSSVRITDILREMLTHQTELNTEFKRVLHVSSIENKKALMASMVRQILHPNAVSEEVSDHASFALSELDRAKLFRAIPELDKSILGNQYELYEFSIRDILIAFALHDVDPTHLELFITFLVNDACRTFMNEIREENRPVRIGALHALVTLFRVFYFKTVGR